MQPFGRRAAERGATAVLVALGLVALLGVASLAIDIGMLLTARTEAQRTADAAALAGAGEWRASQGDDGTTRSTAQDIASINPVIQEQVSVEDEDVEILPTDNIVRVTVHRTEERDNPVPTFFARVLGINLADISAVAAAQVTSASTGSCPLPVALIDEWVDGDSDQLWDGPPTDTYVPYPEAGYTGYSTDDIGMQIEIKDVEQGEGEGPPMCADTGTFEPCNAFGDPSWDCWYLEEPPTDNELGGVDALSPRIRGCVIDGLDLGDPIWSSSGAGNKQSLMDDFKFLVDSDPDAYWDPMDNCPKRGTDTSCITSSVRMRSIPLIDPTTVQPDGGANTNAIISNWAAIFIEKVSCSPTVAHGGGPAGQWNVYARLSSLSGSGSGGMPGSLLFSIQLVE
ncbi:MAG: pilus assembly protein TadG-related protein [Gemmatimonadota bacterium]